MASYQTTLAVTMQNGVSPVAVKIANDIAKISQSLERVDEMIEANQKSLDDWSKKLASAEYGSKEWEEATETLSRLFEESQRLTGAKMEVESNLPKVTGEANDLGRAVQDTGSKMTAFKSILMGIGVGIGVGIFNLLTDAVQRLAGVIPGLINQGQSFAQTIDQIADVSGESAEEVSRLAGIFQYVGIPVGTLESILPRLTSSLAQNADEWQALGVDMYDAQGNMKTGVDLLEELRQKLGGVIAQGGANVLDDLMGGRQSWAQIIDYLKLTDQQVVMLKGHMDEYGYTLSAASVATAELAQRAQNDLGIAIQGVANTIFTAVAPAITTVVSAIGDFIRQNAQAIATFVSQVAGFILGMIQGIMGAMGVATSFTQTIANVGATTQKTTDAYLDYVKAKAEDEKQSVKTGNAGAAGAARQGEAIRKLDAQQERYFRRELARIDGILAKQLEALDKAEEKQDESRSREDLTQRVVIAETRVAAGFDPTAAAELKDAQEELADFEATVARNAQRERITDTQEAIRKITAIESTAVTTGAALRQLGRKQDQAEAKAAEARKKGDYAEARRQELIIDAIVATRRRLLQKQQNEEVMKGMAAQTGAVAAATKAQQGFWTRLLKNLEREKKVEKAKEVVGHAAATGAMIGMTGKLVDKFNGGGSDTITGAMEEARLAGIEFADSLKKAVDDLLPVLQGVAGAFAAMAHFTAGVVGWMQELLRLVPKLPDWLPKALMMTNPVTGAPLIWDWLVNGKTSGGRRDRPGGPGGAEGGIFQGGRTIKVGELGPELITLGSTSRVIPNNQLGGGTAGAVPVVIPIQIDGREIARVTDKHLYWMQQTAPASRRIG